MKFLRLHPDPYPPLVKVKVFPLGFNTPPGDIVIYEVGEYVMLLSKVTFPDTTVILGVKLPFPEIVVVLSI